MVLCNYSQTATKITDAVPVTAKVVHIYDGDTFYITVPEWPDICGKRMPVRIYGIDCPELKTNNPKEHELGIKAKDFVTQLIKQNDDTVTLSNMRRDKYFRILCDVKVGNTDLSSALIKEKLARKYDGGKKEPWVFETEPVQ